jgi:hypothetical protein
MARIVQPAIAPTHYSLKETHTMKSIVTGTVAALVLGAALANAQNPPAAQPPSPTLSQPPATQAQPSQPAEPRSTAAKSQTSTFTGYLKGSADSGFTLSPTNTRSSASTPGATATAGAPTVTYSIVTADGSKVNLGSMADQCVEVTGVLGPETARTAPAAESAKPGASAAHRTFTVASIKQVEGGCK